MLKQHHGQYKYEKRYSIRFHRAIRVSHVMCLSPSQICSLTKFSRPIIIGILDTLIGMTGKSVLLAFIIRELNHFDTACLHAVNAMSLFPRDGAILLRLMTWLFTATSNLVTMTALRRHLSTILSARKLKFQSY